MRQALRRAEPSSSRSRLVTAGPYLVILNSSKSVSTYLLRIHSQSTANEPVGTSIHSRSLEQQTASLGRDLRLLAWPDKKLDQIDLHLLLLMVESGPEHQIDLLIDQCQLQLFVATLRIGLVMHLVILGRQWQFVVEFRLQRYS